MTDEVIELVKQFAKEKKYNEIVAGKPVYEWIKELDLYKELEIPDPKADKPL